MKSSRIVRMVKIILLLQAGKGHNVNSLAEQCDVSRRTIFRDLEDLKLAGLSLKYDEEQQCYHIPGTRLLPPTNFTAEEALALIVLCQELGDSNLPFYEPARGAALKLESTLPLRLREQLRHLTGAIEIQLQKVNVLEGQKPVYQQLLDAAAKRRCVRLRYQSLTEWEEICTKLSPYRLLFSRRSWYVIGRSSLHRAKRTFNVSRILEIETLEDTFKIPRGFSIERYLRNAWNLIPEPGPDHHVVIRFSKMVAQNVSEVTWHKTQKVHFNDDGSLDFHVTVSGLGEISWWILGYGDQAQVLQPPELRRLVLRRAKRLVELYGDE